MEQPPQSRSTPAPPNQSGPSGDTAGAAAASSPAAPAARVCPTCGEPRQADARYCEECGFDFGSEAVPPAAAPAAERSLLTGPVLWLVLVFWVVLAIGGLYFLYTALYAL